MVWIDIIYINLVLLLLLILALGKNIYISGCILKKSSILQLVSVLLTLITIYIFSFAIQGSVIYQYTRSSEKFSLKKIVDFPIEQIELNEDKHRIVELDASCFNSKEDPITSIFVFDLTLSTKESILGKEIRARLIEKLDYLCSSVQESKKRLEKLSDNNLFLLSILDKQPVSAVLILYFGENPRGFSSIRYDNIERGRLCEIIGDLKSITSPHITDFSQIVMEIKANLRRYSNNENFTITILSDFKHEANVDLFEKEIHSLKNDENFRKVKCVNLFVLKNHNESDKTISLFKSLLKTDVNIYPFFKTDFINNDPKDDIQTKLESITRKIKKIDSTKIVLSTPHKNHRIDNYSKMSLKLPEGTYVISLRNESPYIFEDNHLFNIGESIYHEKDKLVECTYHNNEEKIFSFYPANSHNLFLEIYKKGTNQKIQIPIEIREYISRPIAYSFMILNILLFIIIVSISILTCLGLRCCKNMISKHYKNKRKDSGNWMLIFYTGSFFFVILSFYYIADTFVAIWKMSKLTSVPIILIMFIFGLVVRNRYKRMTIKCKKTAECDLGIILDGNNESK